MTDGEQRVNPLVQALDVCLYAPLGFALEARSLLPRFVDRGKSQIVLARVIGKYAVKRGNSAAEGLALRVSDQAVGTLRLLGAVPDAPVDTSGEAAGVDEERSLASSPDHVSSEHLTTDEDQASDQDTSGVSGVSEASAPPAEGKASSSSVDLAIPDYDSLSASQVVPRLASLSAAELEGVRAYETATRGRKTILNRVAQLQSA